MYPTTSPRERAYLIGVELKRGRPLLPVEESLDELERLAQTAGLDVVGRTYQRFDSPDPATYIGSGKVEEVKTALKEFDADVALFDDELSPRHQRELERAFGEEIKVIDRTALILDIFAQHAHTAEGQLQVELAQLEYRLPRLTRMWTHLARQAGGRAGGGQGGVGVRGPGEKQLEMDRRDIGRRIATVKEELEKVRYRREQQRDKRQQTALPVVAIVGYTNAGKSTLLNRLSGSEIWSADMLFATLDPTTRRVEMPSGREALFTDTVGFIQKLPTQIVAAFRATLEEIADADVILHVVDATHPNAVQQIEAVDDTLAVLEVDHLPLVMALNKVDQLSQDVDPLEKLGVGHTAVPISALAGYNIETLLLAVEAVMERYLDTVRVFLPYERGDLVSLFYERGQVEEESHEAEGVCIWGRLPERLLPTFEPYTVGEDEEEEELKIADGSTN
ncbi:MAG: GTPase HflX [Candidatus Promineifilaceae bacterium]|nr:GTPase HflX [Candidatus Promineifilaceae bacterium]